MKLSVIKTLPSYHKALKWCEAILPSLEGMLQHYRLHQHESRRVARKSPLEKQKYTKWLVIYYKLGSTDWLTCTILTYPFLAATWSGVFSYLSYSSTSVLPLRSFRRNCQVAWRKIKLKKERKTNGNKVRNFLNFPKWTLSDGSEPSFYLFITWLRSLDKKKNTKQFHGNQPDIDDQWEIYHVLIPVLYNVHWYRFEHQTYSLKRCSFSSQVSRTSNTSTSFVCRCIPQGQIQGFVLTLSVGPSYR